MVCWVTLVLLALFPSGEQTSLHTSTVVGRRVYMAHEFSQGTVSPAVDTYALGVVSNSVIGAVMPNCT